MLSAAAHSSACRPEFLETLHVFSVSLLVIIQPLGSAMHQGTNPIKKMQVVRLLAARSCAAPYTQLLASSFSIAAQVQAKLSAQQAPS